MIIFEISDEEEKKFEKWREKQDKIVGTSGYSYVFKLTEIGLGESIQVVCHKTGESIDITDYACW